MSCMPLQGIQRGEAQVQDNVLVDLVEKWLDSYKCVPLDTGVLVKDVEKCCRDSRNSKVLKRV